MNNISIAIQSTFGGALAGEIFSQKDNRPLTMSAAFGLAACKIQETALPYLSYVPVIGVAIQGALQPEKTATLTDRAKAAFVGSIMGSAANYAAAAACSSFIPTLAPVLGAVVGIHVAYNISLCMLKPVNLSQ